MALRAYNLKNVAQTIVGTSIVLPASTQAGVRGAPANVTAHFASFSTAQFAAAQTQANPGGSTPPGIAYEWTEQQEFPTPGLAVTTTGGFMPADDFLLFASPAGVAGAGGTATTPCTSADAQNRLPKGYYKRCQLLLLPGFHSYPGADTTFPIQAGNASSPFMILGDYVSMLGDLVATAVDANGKSITAGALAAITPVAATGSVQCDVKANYRNNDVLVCLLDGSDPAVNHQVIFEAKVDGSFVAVAGRTTVDLSAAVTAQDVATALGTAINAIVAGLTVTAGSPTAGLLPLTNDATGPGGNMPATAFTHAAAHVVTGMSGGTAVPTLDLFADRELQVIVGGVVQQQRKVRGNSITGQFDVNQKLSPVPAPGAIFRIVTASAINVTQGPVVVSPGVACQFGWKAIEWYGTNTIGFTDRTGLVGCEGVRIRGVSNGSRANCMVRRASNGNFFGMPAPWADDGANNPFNATRAPSGISFINVNLNCDDTGSLQHQGTIRNTKVSVTKDCNALFTLLSAVGSSVIIDADGNARFTGDTTSNPIAMKMDGSDSSTLDQVQVLNGGSHAVTGPIDYSNSLGHQIFCDKGGVINPLGSAGAANAITGTSATAGKFGVFADDGAKVVLGNAFITLAGAGGQLKNGNQPVMTWAAFIAAYPNAATTKKFVDARAPMLAPIKYTFTGLTAADAFDITTLLAFATPATTPPPALVVGALRVTAAGNANSVGAYHAADTGGTPISPAASTVVGLATLSDNGKTITFPAGSNVTAFVVEYVPADLAQYGYAEIVNSAA